MAEISLTRGLIAIVDDDDAAVISGFSWNAFRCRSAKTWYARTTVYSPTKQDIFMHALILPAPPGMEVDHKDLNGLNNQRSNLRLATRSQNMANRVWHVGRSKSGFKGVYRRGSRFQASIRVNGKAICLGSFGAAEDAAAAYDSAALTHFGEFARLNLVVLQGGRRG